MEVPFGVLDQVAIFRGSSADEAARETADLAERVENLGCTRFWVAEHHQDPSRACASPEVLASFIAARTAAIRVGAGCVILSHTTPARVVEQFQLLDAMAPGRVDLGLGRGPASKSAVISPSKGTDPFAAQVQEVLRLLQPANHDPAHVAAEFRRGLEPWLMGSGVRGALTAATFGLPFAFAQFAHDKPRPDIAALYRSEFKPGHYGQKPRFALTIRVNCAETDREAQRLALAVWLPALRRATPDGTWTFPTYPSLDDVREYVLSAEERRQMAANPLLTVTGDPASVRSQLTRLNATYRADEMVLTTTCPGFAQRAQTFQLLAAAYR
jgi:luciferase family oxidoreductase group 1